MNSLVPTVLQSVTLVLYLASGILYLLLLHRPGRFGRLERTCKVMLWLAVVSHAGTLAARTLATGQLPFTQVTQTASFFGWLLVAAFLVLDLRYRLPVLATVVVPLALVSVLFSVFARAQAASSERVLQGHWLVVHVALIILAYASLALSFCGAVIYLVLERRLKARKFGSVMQRLPSLAMTDDLVYRTSLAGFSLLTLGLGIGAAWSLQTAGPLFDWTDPKVALSVATWLAYAVYLHARLALGWKGHKANLFILVGFACMIITFFGVRHPISLNGP